MLKQPKHLPNSPGRGVSTFRAKWVTRRLQPKPYHPGKWQDEWTPQHGKMLTHIGLAIKAGCEVSVTFRKPTEADNIADAAEIGEVSITGIIPARKR